MEPRLKNSFTIIMYVTTLFLHIIHDLIGSENNCRLRKYNIMHELYMQPLSYITDTSK